MYNIKDSLHVRSFASTILFVIFALFTHTLSFGLIASDIQNNLCLNEEIFFEGDSESAIFEKKISSQTGYVVSDDPLWGRLGNQLFTIATVLAYAWDYGFKPVFPALNREDHQLSYNRDKIFFRLDATTDPIQIDHQFRSEGPKFVPIPRFSNHKNLSLQGQFVSWRYFHHHYHKLLATFAPSAEVSNYLKNKYADLLSKPNTVAVHLRTYSRQLHNDGLPFVGLNFLKLAFSHYPSNSIFVIFSDRINWCIQNLSQFFPEKNFVFIEGNDPIEDLFLMSMMKHQIISNSTFSWWAAYLNKNRHKLICSPQQFFKDAAFLPIKDFSLPSWRIIYHDFTTELYPEDMGFYDEETEDDRLDGLCS